MSKSVLGPQGLGTCMTTLDARDGGCHIFVACTRLYGHPSNGHEFVGSIGGKHLHVVWGEPEEGRTP